jgi:long-chain acyl-CoA synthetase
MDQWMSYGELDQYSGALGAYLQGLGLEPGARVAIMLPNVPQFAVTMAAVLRAGYTCVNVNPLYTERELEHQLKDSGATAIVILENFAHTLAEVVDHTNVKHVVMAPWATCWASGMASGSPSPCATWPRWCPPTSCR